MLRCSFVFLRCIGVLDKGGGGGVQRVRWLPFAVAPSMDEDVRPTYLECFVYGAVLSAC